VLDDFGDTVALTARVPHRIVSLDPATTAMLFAMGMGGSVVGRTQWDSYPPAVRGVPDVGDGLRPNVEAVLARRPDLVVLYASADDRAAAHAFRTAGIATLSIRIDRLSDFRRALQMIGRVVHDSAAAAVVADSVLGTIDRVHRAAAGLAAVPLVWEVDQSPMRVIGGGSYLNEIVADAGGRNLYGDVPDPSPQVSLEDVLRRDPDVVLTSPSGARAIRANPAWARWLAASRHRLVVPDTALVGMPSVRMGEAAVALAQLLHPGTVPVATH
jgi:ABC-type Fe3+-hydroxamate transport system substrate-binding protein